MNKPSLTNDRKPCNQKHLDQFLNSEHYRLENSELLEHLDSCVECRTYLDQQAAEPELWQKTESHLRPTEFDIAGSSDCSAATVDHCGPRPVAVRDVIEKLAPTDNPHHLGRLGSYEVTGVVGVGGMGVVLKAIDPSLDRVVAVKAMAPQLAGNEKARKRFSREAKAAAAVIHPNVIPIHSVSGEGSLPYLVMAYIRGGSLQTRLEQQGSLSTIEVLRIGSQISAGLVAAHEQGLVHRDIKPENILMEEGIERITITDFGLARAVDDNTVTQLGAIAGTPRYMSPEQAQGEKLDQKSDLFSLGSVLYALCTGRPPYQADTSYGVMRMIIDEAPTPINEINPEVPNWLAKLVAKLMAKDKSQRFDSAEEVHKLLEQCLGHLQKKDQSSDPEPTEFLRHVVWPTEANPQGQTTENRRLRFTRWSAILSATALLTAAGIFGFFQLASLLEMNNGQQKLHAYLQNGSSVVYSGKLVDDLLPNSRGRKYLSQLGNEFDQVAYLDKNLPLDLKAVVAVLADDRKASQHPELRFTTLDKQLSEANIPLPEQICVSRVQFASETLGDCRLQIEYIASIHPADRYELKSQFNLSPGYRYRVDVPLASLMDHQTDWTRLWREGELLPAEPKQASNNFILLQRIENDQKELAIVSIRFIVSALDLYKVTHNDYPTMDEGLEALADLHADKDPNKSFLNDPWGNPYSYKAPGTHGSRPDVWSIGPDGDANTDDDIQSWNLPPLTRVVEDDKTTPNDAKNILGAWQVTYVEDSGQVAPLSMPDGKKLNAQFNFDTNSMKTNYGEHTSEGSYTIDSSTNPKSIDLIENGRTKRGIYDLQGDTLRICISEQSNARPTAFDSQPDSPNDLIFILKRIPADAIDQEKDAVAPQEGDRPTAAYLRRLIPKAASISNEEFRNLTGNPNPNAIESQTFSMVFLTLPDAEDDPEAQKEMDFLTEIIRPSDLAKVMARSRSKGYATAIQPEFINECEIDSTRGDQESVFGHVEFCAPGLYRGRVEFRSRKIDGEWKIDQFSLPSRKICIELDRNGVWNFEEQRESPDPLEGD